MKTNKIIIIDFDDTLFNTRNFAFQLATIFKKYANVDFFTTQTRDKNGNYSFKKHLKLVDKPARKAVRKNVDALLKNGSNLLFDDVKVFLNEFRKEKIILLTRGDVDFQKSKLDNCDSSFHNLVDKIIITPKIKFLEIKKLSPINNPSKLFFIDNEPLELKTVKKHFPQITTIMIERYGPTKSSLSPDFRVSNLIDAIKIIRLNG